MSKARFDQQSRGIAHPPHMFSPKLSTEIVENLTIY
jgi:hypothetical protein